MRPFEARRRAHVLRSVTFLHFARETCVRSGDRLAKNTSPREHKTETQNTDELPATKQTKAGCLPSSVIRSHPATAIRCNRGQQRAMALRNSSPKAEALQPRTGMVSCSRTRKRQYARGKSYRLTSISSMWWSWPRSGKSVNASLVIRAACGTKRRTSFEQQLASVWMEMLEREAPAMST